MLFENNLLIIYFSRLTDTIDIYKETMLECKKLQFNNNLGDEIEYI